MTKEIPRLESGTSCAKVAGSPAWTYGVHLRNRAEDQRASPSITPSCKRPPRNPIRPASGVQCAQRRYIRASTRISSRKTQPIKIFGRIAQNCQSNRAGHSNRFGFTASPQYPPASATADTSHPSSQDSPSPRLPDPAPKSPAVPHTSHSAPHRSP